MSHGVQRLLAFERNTADLDRAVAFYRDALGFAVTGDGDPPAWTRLPGAAAAPARSARLSLGDETITLTEFAGAAPYPFDANASDLAFQHCAIVVADMRGAHERAMQRGATPITQGGPQALPPSTGSVVAFKFRDPDGHPLELIHFPAGTGDPRWQAASRGDAALGIDHSAISVGDVDRGVRFYRLLGLRDVARGVNRGAGQQRLDDLADVVVDVLALEASAGRTPHLELLGYREPRGRANRATDIAAVAADRVVWQADAVDVLLDALVDADYMGAVIASGVVDSATVALVRDPDGHLLVLQESAARG